MANIKSISTEWFSVKDCLPPESANVIIRYEFFYEGEEEDWIRIYKDEHGRVLSKGVNRNKSNSYAFADCQFGQDDYFDPMLSHLNGDWSKLKKRVTHWCFEPEIEEELE